MAHATILTVEGISSGNAGFFVYGWPGSFMAAGVANKQTSRFAADGCFKTAWFRQGRQIETHQQNHNRRHYRQDDDRPHCT